MSARKGLDTSHPDCAEYTVKFRAIWDPYFKREDEERAKYPTYRSMQDHYADIDAVLLPLHRKCAEQTKALWEEYDYLFTVDVDESQISPEYGDHLFQLMEKIYKDSTSETHL